MNNIKTVVYIPNIIRLGIATASDRKGKAKSMSLQSPS